MIVAVIAAGQGCFVCEGTVLSNLPQHHTTQAPAWHGTKTGMASDKAFEDAELNPCSHC